MTTGNININTSFEIHNCVSCGIPFFIESVHSKSLQQTGARFFCINGHSQVFTQTLVKDNEALRKKISELENKLLEKPQFENFHNEIIGLEILRLVKKKMTISNFSRRIELSRNVCYDIFKRDSIDSELLFKISKALNVDLFTFFSQRLK